MVGPHSLAPLRAATRAKVARMEDRALAARLTALLDLLDAEGATPAVKAMTAAITERA